MNKRERVARAICAEKCAFMGEPPCYTVEGEWPNPNCAEPGCHAEADAAIAALEPVTVQEAARVLLPWFEQQHYNWAVSKGRNPKDYLSPHTHAADTLRALAEQDGK